MKWLIIIFLFLLIPFFLFLNSPDNDQPDDDQPDKPKIGSTITEARDISGQWKGRVSFTDRVFSCAYKGDMTLNLQQNGNNVNGNYVVTIDEASGESCLRIGTPFPGFFVGGTISSSAINMLVANTDPLEGSFTTDTMTLRQTKCKECGSGPAMVLQGPVNLLRS